MKHFTNIQKWLVLICTMAWLACVGCRPASAAPATDSASAKQHQRTVQQADAAVRKIVNNFNAWLQEPWSTDPSSVYTDLRRHIDQQASSGQDPVNVFNSYEAQWHSRPNDLPSLFAYVYSAFVVHKLHEGHRSHNSLDATDAFFKSIAYHRSPPPHLYSFVRLAFIMVGYNPKLGDVGQRLLAVDPGDVDVQYALAQDLNFSDAPVDCALAEKYTEDVERAAPDEYRTKVLRNEVDWRTAMFTHDPKVERKFIAENQRWVDATPIGSEERREFERNVSGMKARMAQWASEPAPGRRR